MASDSESFWGIGFLLFFRLGNGAKGSGGFGDQADIVRDIQVGHMEVLPHAQIGDIQLKVRGDLIRAGIQSPHF